MKNILKTITKPVEYWYLYLILGLVFIFTGFWTISEPVKSYATLSLLFSILFLISGVIYTLFAIGNRSKMHNWGWNLAYGVILLILGINLVASPDFSRATLALFVGFAALMFSFNKIIFAFDLRNYGVKNWVWLLLFGGLSLLFSFLMIINPAIAGLTIIFYTAFTFFFLGVGYIINAFQLRRVKKIAKNIPPEVKERYKSIMEELEKYMH